LRHSFFLSHIDSEIKQNSRSIIWDYSTRILKTSTPVESIIFKLALRLESFKSREIIPIRV